VTRTRGLVRPGAIRWFEYHCDESPESAHRHLFLRSHRRVKVLRVGNLETHHRGSSVAQRALGCCPLVYRVRFPDGLEDDVFEDELLTSRRQFCRPAPPAELPRPAAQHLRGL
jgi:hypothetical protein